MSGLRAPSSVAESEGRTFLLELDRRLERLDREILVSEWNLSVGRSTRGSDQWQLKRARLLSDPQLLPWVRAALRTPWPPLLRRRLELLERILLDARVEQQPDVVQLRGVLQRKIVSFRPRWKGKRVGRDVLHRVLRESESASERRAAFYALEELHRALEEDLRRLIRQRNEYARALGFRTFAEMRLGFAGLSVSRLSELVESVTVPARSQLRVLREKYRDSQRDGGWHPWDLAYARQRRTPLPSRSFPRVQMLPRILAAVRQWGFPVDRMKFHVVFHDLPAGGLTLAPDPPSDVRIQVHPGGGWMAYVVMFHEVGHAVHSASIRAPRHLLRWHENVPGFGAFHEGIGGLFEEIPTDVNWLATVPGISAARAEEFATSAKRTGAIDAAWHASWFRVEQSLYRDPERDPMPEAVRFTRRVFGYDAYPAPSFVDSFFVELPVYAPNYLLATLFDHQIRRSLREIVGDPFWPNRRTGPWLTRQWMAPGSTFDWIPRVKEVTGRPFGAEAFRAYFSE